MVLLAIKIKLSTDHFIRQMIISAHMHRTKCLTAENDAISRNYNQNCRDFQSFVTQIEKKNFCKKFVFQDDNQYDIVNIFY